MWQPDLMNADDYACLSIKRASYLHFRSLSGGADRQNLYFMHHVRWDTKACNSCSKCYAMDCLGTYFLYMPKPNVTRVQSATQWIASVHTLRAQSPTEWTASVYTLHMPKPDITRVQRATQWTASVHTLHMPEPNATRVQSATQWTALIHTLHMPNQCNSCSKCYVTHRLLPSTASV